MRNQFADSEFEQFDCDTITNLGNLRLCGSCAPVCLRRTLKFVVAPAQGVLAAVRSIMVPPFLARRSSPQAVLGSLEVREGLRGPARQAFRDGRNDGGERMNGRSARRGVVAAPFSFRLAVTQRHWRSVLRCKRTLEPLTLMRRSEITAVRFVSSRKGWTVRAPDGSSPSVILTSTDRH